MRKRIEKGMKDMSEGQKTLERTNVRMTKTIPKDMERQDQDVMSQSPAASSGTPTHERSGMEHLQQPPIPADEMKTRIQ